MNDLFEALLEASVEGIEASESMDERRMVHAMVRSLAIQMAIVSIFLPPRYVRLAEMSRKHAQAALEYLEVSESER